MGREDRPSKAGRPSAPIGVFDSGYGGLTVLKEIMRVMPEQEYLYLGDNARAPYGTRSFDIVYRFTLDAVKYLFEQGCRLVVLACNTASAKALRNIQMLDLPKIDPERRVLGVIRPTVEKLPQLTRNGHIGVLGTPGTIQSQSYDLEIQKFFPQYTVTGHGCPMWVPLVENREADTPGADYFVEQEIRRLMRKDPEIDTIILGCTHYPLLIDKIRQYVPEGVRVVPQGEIVAESLKEYLQRHPGLTENGPSKVTYLTTESAERFGDMASLFLGKPVKAQRVEL
ncbi:MAG: glutamate racemase [Bacteroidales bacterium]|nr:glutamate racemase [Bacteroidales bacterium]MCD8394049.1 glutamate racemase [Bacteroidales bacterium]